jgi:hypothetical protein
MYEAVSGLKWCSKVHNEKERVRMGEQELTIEKLKQGSENRAAKMRLQG